MLSRAWGRVCPPWGPHLDTAGLPRHVLRAQHACEVPVLFQQRVAQGALPTVRHFGGDVHAPPVGRLCGVVLLGRDLLRRHLAWVQAKELKHLRLPQQVQRAQQCGAGSGERWQLPFAASHRAQARQRPRLRVRHVHRMRPHKHEHRRCAVAGGVAQQATWVNMAGPWSLRCSVNTTMNWELLKWRSIILICVAYRAESTKSTQPPCLGTWATLARTTSSRFGCTGLPHASQVDSLRQPLLFHVPSR